MAQTLVPAFFAALLSSGLFLLVLGLGTSFLFLFLPTLPLFSLGLSRQTKAGPPAAAIATLIVGVVAGPNEAGLYIFFLALPAFYLAHKALLSEDTQWFPLGQALNTLTLYACTAVALTTLWY